jgi:hypothetical protein
MANYEGFMVTEKTFHVDDPKAFEDSLLGLGVRKDNWDGGPTFTVGSDGSYWLGGYDADLQVWVDDKDDFVSLVPTIQKHMRVDSICVVMHVGYEKLRYVTGYVAVISKTRMRTANLDRLARGLEADILRMRPKPTIRRLSVPSDS